MHSKVPAALLAAFLSATAATPTEAADVTPGQAEALQSQMQGWLQGMLGLGAQSPGRALRVRSEGDHYRIELPLGTPRDGQPSPVTLSASARPAEGGRWTFEGPKLPSPATFTLNMPAPAANGKAPAAAVPVDYTITVGSQDSRGTYDPSFATPSTLTTSSRDVQIQARSATDNQLTRFERSSGTSTLRPSGSDRADLSANGTIEGYALTSRSPDGPVFEFSAQQVRATSEITALSRDRVATMLPAVFGVVSGFLGGMPPSGGSGASAARPSFDPQLLRTILQSLQDLASEFTLNETFDGIALRAGTRGGAANQARIGMGAKSDGGLLQAYMDLGLDGLVAPDPALGAMADLLPRKVALRPVLAGVPTEELTRWLAAVGDAKDGTRVPGFPPLFRRAGVSAGLDSFAIDIGGASFAGAGKLTVVSPESVTGQAQVTATNFDDLIAHANAVPELAGVLPAFLFVKGVGRNVEGRLVWDVTYRDNRLLVNGTDLSAMAGGRPPGR